MYLIGLDSSAIWDIVLGNIKEENVLFIIMNVHLDSVENLVLCFNGEGYPEKRTEFRKVSSRLLSQGKILTTIAGISRCKLPLIDCANRTARWIDLASGNVISFQENNNECLSLSDVLSCQRKPASIFRRLFPSKD